MFNQSIQHTLKRYRTLKTHRVSALPIAILMPHSACNCRCVMCDIWKDNKNVKQLTEDDIASLLVSLKKLDTQQVLMSGGEALLNQNFFRFCEMLKKHDLRVSLLSTGITLARNAVPVTQWVNDVVVSLDGDEALHNSIRNLPNAFFHLKEGIERIKNIDPIYRITARSVIHRLNFRKWPAIIETARRLGVDQVSFLPADVSSHAFNREVLWSEQRQQDILPRKEELHELLSVTKEVIANLPVYGPSFIAENAEKIMHIHDYYAACYGLQSFPFKKCNAPWVSAVVEPDGTVRPCFFHPPVGNIREKPLSDILNSTESIRFRKELDIMRNSTCMKCVCHLCLSPGTKLN